MVRLDLSPGDTFPELVITPLNSWKAISVTGEDKKSYLQGQLTCDLVSLPSDSSTLGAHCDAKGKVWSIFRCFNHNEGYGLFFHASASEKSLQELKKYSVFSKVDIVMSDDIPIGVMGSKASQIIAEIIGESIKTLSEVQAVPGGTAVRIEENRWLLLLNQSEAELTIEKLQGAVIADEAVWDKADIENAIPRVTESIQNTYIPQALNLQAIGGISFSKGCYTGQETVARAKYRGTSKRSMSIVKGHAGGEVTLPSEVERSVGENWRSAGPLIACYQYSDGTFVGLAVLPNNLDEDTRLRISDQTAVDLSVETLPYVLDAE